MSCPTYVAPFQAQLGQKYGGTICTAVAASRVVAEATCGKHNPTGAHIRSLTNEPVPDPKSPGLSIPQVVSVIEGEYHVPMDVYIGTRALTWEQYESKREQGHPAILQIGYGPIADSSFDAGGGFQGNHAICETTDATYDSLADGRRKGIWKFDGRLYPRSLMRQAAAQLVIGPGRHAMGVWCAFAPDVVSETHASIHPVDGTYPSLNVKNGVITGTTQHQTGGYSAKARMRCIPYPARHVNAYCLELLDGVHRGLFVSTSWEVK